MTLFEFAVPLIALAVAGVGTVILRREARAIDRRRAERLGKGPH
ncbi:hypothetical protein [Roseivivax sp. CAU 1761]